jgi:hypothetical protein
MDEFDAAPTEGFSLGGEHQPTAPLVEGGDERHQLLPKCLDLHTGGWKVLL